MLLRRTRTPLHRLVSKSGAIFGSALFCIGFCFSAVAADDTRASEWFASVDGSTEIVQVDTHYAGRDALLAVAGIAGLAMGGVAWLVTLQRRRLQGMLKQLSDTEDRLREAQAIANVGSWTRDFATGETYWSPEARSLLMLDDSQKKWGHYETFVHPEDLGVVVEAIARAYCRGGTYHCDHRLVCPSGVIKHVRLVGRVYPKGRGNGAVFEHGTVQDITERKLIETHLRESEEKLRELLQALPVALMVVEESSGTPRYVSPSAFGLLGLAPDTDLTQLSVVKHWVSAESYTEFIAMLTSADSSPKTEAMLRKTDGAVFWASVQAQITRYAGERAILLCLQDISAQRAYLDELEKRATRDPVTGVFNSHSMQEVARKEFRRALRYNQPVALVVISLDQMRALSEGFGVAAAQQLIKQFVDMLKDGVRVEDSIGRLNQDEFVLLLVGATREGAQLVAERIRKMCEEEYFELQRQQLRFTLSAGVAAMEAPDDRVDDVMARAIDGLHQARRIGANCVVSRPHPGADQQKKA